MLTVKPRTLLTFLFLSLVGALQAPASDERTKLLPFLGLNLEGARYAPAGDEFAWVGRIGARADLVQRGRWSAYFNPDVETILGHRVRSFEAVQANYSLEIGLHRAMSRGRISPFFHHASRHVQDRDKVQAVDWNFLGARFAWPWPERFNRGGGWSASLGVATLSSGVEYNFEARLTADIDLLRKGNSGFYLLVDVRHVGAEPTTGFPRDQLTDLRAEAGWKQSQEASHLAFFVAYERRGDALIQRALVIDRTLFGFRIRGQRQSSPAVPPLP